MGDVMPAKKKNDGWKKVLGEDHPDTKDAKRVLGSLQYAKP